MAHLPPCSANQRTKREPSRLRGILQEDVLSFSAQLHHDTRPLSHSGAGTVGVGAQCPRFRRDLPLDERDDVCGHFQRSRMSLLHSGAHRLLPHVEGRYRNAESSRPRRPFDYEPQAPRNDSLRDQVLPRSPKPSGSRFRKPPPTWPQGMSALAVYANIIADATAMDEDEMFN